MKVLITGGAGFLGQQLVRALLRQGSLELADDGGRVVAQPDFGHRLLRHGRRPDQRPARLEPVRRHRRPGHGGRAGRQGNGASVVHLAAVVSGTAEADFDLGMRVNLDGTRNLLDACRAAGHRPRLLFSSSIAVFGGDLPTVVTDATTPTPQGSYGIQKLIGELLVQDYTRKGFIDGRSVRVPTATVRPGTPNGAASGFASGIIREPLSGIEAVLPVPARRPCGSPRRVPSSACSCTR